MVVEEEESCFVIFVGFSGFWCLNWIRFGKIGYLFFLVRFCFFVLIEGYIFKFLGFLVEERRGEELLEV